MIILFIGFMITEGYCNPVIVEPSKDPINATIILIFMFFIGTSIEYGVFQINYIKMEHKKRNLLIMVFKINFVTFPLTQILAYIVYIYYSSFFWAYIVGIEVLVILIEFALLRTEFKKRYEDLLSPRKLLVLLILANFLSFLLGLLIISFPLL